MFGHEDMPVFSRLRTKQVLQDLGDDRIQRGVERVADEADGPVVVACCRFRGLLAQARRTRALI
jgi:hypothetical protein